METVNDLWARLDQLNDIGAALSREKNLGLLLEKILLAAKEITHADGGTVYRVSADRQHLHYEIVRTDSLNIAFGGSAREATSGIFPDLPLYLPDGSPNNHMVAAYSALQAWTVNIPDAYEAEGFDFSGTRKFDARTGYRSQSFLTVPMKNHENEIIGVLQLINAISPKTGKTVAFSAQDQRLVESLASQAAVALTNRMLIEQLENLFESTIRMINTAINEKSPYTNGHCERVPELTMMIAEAVDSETQGPLADFSMSDADRYELRIASLMHDCGKITTPVHVVDKSTKLETIYDRIHLIDARIEIVRRDARIRKLEAVVAGKPKAEAEAEWEAFTATLDDDRALLIKSNIGGERMHQEDVDRIRQIASRYRWHDAVGVEHPLLDEDEVENLTIVAGTLTAKERNVINYHIVATIKMLELLPWPRHLKRVPEFAGGHHERMDGRGYPKGLRGDQMSVQARMMAIADIFEALTAADRPYKKPMKVSQALSILESFKSGGHIDPELYDVFVRRQVYQRYAKAYLKPEQLDV
ncbi:MAG: GAF domain-containing protein [Betaproteobacteria bacterium]|nr:GAF domain-containing protein [Betaproteobacteria bacterium]